MINHLPGTQPGGLFPWGGIPALFGAVASPATVRDYDILQAIAAILVATAAFDGVHLDDLPDRKGTSAAEGNAAFVTPSDWDEAEWADGDDQVLATRRARWTLTLIVRRADVLVRDRELDRLLSVAQNALNGVSILNVTIPAWTKLGRGKYGKSSAPERRMTVVGEFAYLIRGYDGHAVEA